MSHRAGRALTLGLSVVCALAIAPAGVASAAGSTSGHRQASVSPAAGPGSCPTVMPLASVHAGQKGVGWTVEQGHNREAFKVKVLDILPDGIAPGRDMIVVKVSDLPGNNMIARAGGIWSGMSGSPVYIDGQLIGSVSYGFSFSPSPIGGLTPAEDMLDLLTYPASSAAAAETPSRVQLPAAMARRVAAAGHMSVERAFTLNRLAVPVSVSGLGKAARERLQKRFDAAGFDVIVTSGTSAQTPSGTSTFDTPQAGGNFAGVLSYGDVTAGGIGTTTYVCGDQALAFGHPLLFAGKIAFGANNARAITVIRDDLFGSFKLATIGNPFGKLDQDRLEGVRALLGQAVHVIPVVSEVTAPNIGGHRIGETDVTMSPLVPSFAAEHLYLNVISTFDKQGPGSALVHWTVNGKDANGDHWSLERSNRFASGGDIAGTTADDIYFNLSTLYANGFEKVKFSSISIDASVSDGVRALTVKDVLISKNGGPFRHRDSLKVHPGANLTLRVVMSTFNGGMRTEDLQITVPNDAFGEAGLVVQGGNSGFPECVFDPSACADTFDELLVALAEAPRNDELIARLFSFDEDFNTVVIDEDATTLNSTVSGGVEVFVTIQ